MSLAPPNHTHVSATNSTMKKSLVSQKVKNPPAMREIWVLSLGWEYPLEEGMITHSSILAWRIPWTEEPGGLQSMGSQRVRHDWGTKHTAQHKTPEVFSKSNLNTESHRYCLVPVNRQYPCHVCGHNLSLMVLVIQEGSSGERAGARLLRGAYEFPMSLTLCLLDSLSSLQVGILHLSCHKPKDSKSQIQLCCCFPQLAASAADCKCTRCSQNAAGRFPAVKELE